MMANALDSALPSGPTGKALRPLAALQLTFMIGIVQIVLGLCRLGAVAHYLSFPVMHGFNTAGREGGRWREIGYRAIYILCGR
jgi:MFS superfamily sulfate permease-like transporter